MLFLLVPVTVVLGVVFYYQWIFTYWSKRNLLCFAEPSIPFGNWKAFLSGKLSGGVFTKMAYDEAKKKGFRHAGAFAFFSPYYLPVDPELVKEILQKNFENFSDRGFYTNERDDPLGVNLAFVNVEKWRYLRAKLSPAFSPIKMKAMFDIVVQCAQQLKSALDNLTEVDINDVSVCYTVDIIGACAYGLECNSFKNPNSEFKTFGKKSIDHSSLFQVPLIVFGVTFPKLARALGVRVFNKPITDFFVNLVKDSVRFRKANGVARKDLLQLLLELEEVDVEQLDKNSEETVGVINELAAQVFIFFVAGFETSSTTLTLCLLELALNQEVQEKLRKEVDEAVVKCEGKITYDCLMELKYMGQVVDETLRKYPPVPFLARKCVKDFQVPATAVTVEKGIYAFISILGLHRDPDFYPDPDTFDPERFSEDERLKRPPFTYLPFGEGPRMCPAYRFGLMQIKVGLAILLQHFRFTLNKNTKIPVEINPFSFTLVPKSAVYLNIEKRRA